MTKQEIKQRYLTSGQAAKFLGTSIGRLANDRSRSDPDKGIMFGPPWIVYEGSIRYDIKDLVEYMDKRRKRRGS